MTTYPCNWHAIVYEPELALAERVKKHVLFEMAIDGADSFDMEEGGEFELGNFVVMNEGDNVFKVGVKCSHDRIFTFVTFVEEERGKFVENKNVN